MFNNNIYKPNVFRVFMRRIIMCESKEVTSNPPFGVVRLAEAPLALTAPALQVPEQINLITTVRSR